MRRQLYTCEWTADVCVFFPVVVTVAIIIIIITIVVLLTAHTRLLVMIGEVHSQIEMVAISY